MSIRFLTAWNGHSPGDVATLGNAEAALISGGLARDASESDNETAPSNLTAETAARIAADTALVEALATETAARIAGDAP